MSKITRRDAIKTGAVAAAAMAAPAIVSRESLGQELNLEPEKGAKLRVLRWKRFVQGDEDVWMANTAKFSTMTGIQVRTDHEGFEDVRPKAAVAANVGSGPDIIIGWFDDPHQYPDKLVDLSDVANYLGGKYGGWYPVCERYGKRGNRWIGLPLGAAGATMVHRKSWMNEAGFATFPKDTDGFLKMCQALKAKGHPPGFALGNAVGDGNAWVHWLVWAFGGKMVDEKNNVVINSKETIRALEYARELYQTFIPGTLAWQDPHNNKAFLDGQVSVTNNGISVYYAALNSQDPALKAMVADIEHASFPIGPVGHPTELHLFTQAMLFRYSKYPKAAKMFLKFMWEKEQYAPWQKAAIGYVTHPLKGYEQNDVWSSDPKNLPYRDAVKNMLWHSYAGLLGFASAGVMADYVMVNMVAAAASGQKTPAEAAAEAEKRALRYYKV